MKKVAFIFPGQGSQSVGMGKDLFDNFNEAKKVFKKADEVLGKKISSICFEGPDEELKKTENTQPAILTTSLAALEALKSVLDIEPTFVAGHSLGEYGALYQSGALDLETTFKLIDKRAELMSQVKGGTMAAVLGGDEIKIAECIEEANKAGYVSVANFNCPGQIVITGSDEGVAKAGELLKEAGVKRVLPLAVSGAFHSSLMRDAGVEFEKFLENIEVNDAKIPVFTNVDAQETKLASDFKAKMPKQIYSSVLWTDTINKMIEQGVDTFIEIGPGKVLAGLNKKINKDVITYNIFDKASLEACVDGIKG